MTIVKPYPTARMLQQLVETECMLTDERHVCYGSDEDDDSLDDSETDDSSFDDSSCDESSSTDEDMESDDHVDAETCKLEMKSNVFLSLEMAHKLNLSQSARDLFVRPTHASTERSSSVSANQSSSGIVYALQTESPMAAPVNSITMDRGDCLSPVEVLRSIWREQHPTPRDTIPHDTISTWVPGDVAAYSLPLLSAVRTNDLATIQALHEQNRHVTLQCSNRFGESIVHTVARHGRVEILVYLVEQANVSMHVCCDQGRTILHDAAWSTQPNFECIRYIVHQHPELLWIADNKNFVPLDYAPRSSWTAWNTWLTSHKTLLMANKPSASLSSPSRPTLLTSVSKWLLQGL